jgi:hypothetical protein
MAVTSNLWWEGMGTATYDSMSSISIRYASLRRVLAFVICLKYQLRPFAQQSSEISMLVSAFFSNDPYYPRPVASDTLYPSFKAGYKLASLDHRARASTFLQAIEAEALARGW